MKKIFLFLFLCFGFESRAQKALVDTAVYSQWPKASGYCLSNDGVYTAYSISNSTFSNNTLVVKNNSSWEKEFANVNSGQFSPDSKKFFFLNKDTLCSLILGTESETKTPHVVSYQVLSNAKQWFLTYQLNSARKQLILHDLKTDHEKILDSINSYRLNNNVNPTALLLQKESNNKKTILQWLSLSGDKAETIWEGGHLSNIIFSMDGSRLVFTAKDSIQNIGKQVVWYYFAGEALAKTLKTNTGEYLQADQLIKFDHTGTKLFFRQNEAVIKPKINPALSSVDIYSYKDPKLQSQQLIEHKQTSFAHVYNFFDQQVIRLEQENEQISSPLDDDWILISKLGKAYSEEWNWNKNALCSMYLISTKGQTRKLIRNEIPEVSIFSYHLSPMSKYVIFYDPVKKDFFSYTVSTGVIRNITKGLKAEWTRDNRTDWPDASYEEQGSVSGWTENDNSVLLYSRFDIFQVDPEGKRSPINLTNGYGLRHHIVFKNGLFTNDMSSSIKWTLNPGHPILLYFVSQDNKNEGFCKIVPGKQKDPEILSEQPFHLNQQPSKALYAETYAVCFESAEKSPNYFLTTDFKTFKPLTNVHPEKKYNWLTAELVHWRTPDGKTTQGILYKPENFDSKKKYPVIFHYYERLSSTAYNFLTPGYGQGGGTVDIPTYVSNGYLVFVPDIHFKVGYPGRSALNSIISGAKYLSKFSWVDGKHMGLMGHSFGGFETNYVITHSNLFAAAVSMSSMTDFVSAYGSVQLGGTSRAPQYELNRDRIGATLWQRPDLYLENSPVFKADKVITPVLLMANKKDDDVPYEQGFEFFTALRRLNKKAWMLQYDNGGHGVGGKDEKDLSIRMRQFFDYYLKGLTPPKWMTEGIPASMKQVDSGLEPDVSGKRP